MALDGKKEKDHCSYAGDHAEEPAILISRLLLRMGSTYFTSIRLEFHYRLESVRFEDENEYEYEFLCVF